VFLSFLFLFFFVFCILCFLCLVFLFRGWIFRVGYGFSLIGLLLDYVDFCGFLWCCYVGGSCWCGVGSVGDWCFCNCW